MRTQVIVGTDLDAEIVILAEAELDPLNDVGTDWLTEMLVAFTEPEPEMDCDGEKLPLNDVESDGADVIVWLPETLVPLTGAEVNDPLPDND